MFFDQCHAMTESPAVGVSPPYPVYDFTLSLEQPLVPMPHPFDDFDASMRLPPERGRQDHVDISLRRRGLRSIHLRGCDDRQRIG